MIMPNGFWRMQFSGVVVIAEDGRSALSCGGIGGHSRSKSKFCTWLIRDGLPCKLDAMKVFPALFYQCIAFYETQLQTQIDQPPYGNLEASKCLGCTTHIHRYRLIAGRQFIQKFSKT